MGSRFFSFTVLAFAFSQLFACADGFTNPLKDRDGADPFLKYHKEDGQYYLLNTGGTEIKIRHAPTLAGLKNATDTTVWSSPDHNQYFNLWAPEMWNLNGKWYLLFSAASHDKPEQLYLLKGGTEAKGPYTSPTQLSTMGGIDPTILAIRNTNYLVWSCGASVPGTSHICIAKFEGQKGNSTDLKPQNPVGVISSPTYDWETVGGAFNEGPAALYNQEKGKVYLTYSASWCGTKNYALGLLTYDGKGDPLAAQSWTKSDKPVFTQAGTNHGPGHNGFFTSPDDKETWLVYHATHEDNGHACDNKRYTMASKVTWRTDGSPDFGSPPDLKTELPEPSGEGQKAKVSARGVAGRRYRSLNVEAMDE